MDYHGISKTEVEPETIEHVKKCLGVWDFDGHYQQFKTLGAKRYIVQYSYDGRNPEKKRGTYNLTVSGLNKKVCVPYLLEKYGEKGIFSAFDDELYIPPEYTGKNTHTYIDEPRKGMVIDYMGINGYYNEMSSVHLEKSDYSMKLSREYLDYLLNIETIEI